MTVERYLGGQSLPFQVVAYAATSDLRAADISPRQIVKGVLLAVDGQYMLAVFPAARHLHLDELRRQLDRDLGMASDHEVTMVFRDCQPGAVPALGIAYGVETIWDDSLMTLPDLYFHAGDHKRLVHMQTSDYMEIMSRSAHGSFSVPP